MMHTSKCLINQHVTQHRKVRIVYSPFKGYRMVVKAIRGVQTGPNARSALGMMQI